MNVRRTLEFPWYGPHPNGTTHELLRKSSDIRESKGYRLRIIRATATCCICCILLQFPCLVSWPAPLSRLHSNGTSCPLTTRRWEGIQISWSNKNQICLYWSCPVLLLLHLAWNPFQDMQQGKGCVLHTHLSHSISETQRLWCVYIYIYILFSLT